jgi:hypothetical protein
MWLCFQKYTSNLMRGSLFQIITVIEPTATRAGKVELQLQLEKAVPTAM